MQIFLSGKQQFNQNSHTHTLIVLLLGVKSLEYRCELQNIPTIQNACSVFIRITLWMNVKGISNATKILLPQQ